MTLREVYAKVPEPHRTDLLEKIRYVWPENARENQVPVGSDRYQVIVGGRGSGKTRAGAEWVREKAREPNQRLLLVARTAADVRSTLVEGESGVLNVSPPSERPVYHPSMRRLEWSNGTQAFCTSWDEPNSLRGTQAHHSWLDEPGHRLISLGSGMVDAFSYADMATRLSHDSQILITGTSQAGSSDLWDQLLDATKNGYVFRSSTLKLYQNATLDNEENLNTNYVKTVLAKYSGTSRGAQELLGFL